MESVRVLIADFYALLTVRDDVAYVAPLGSEPFDVAPVGTWCVADVRCTPAWA
jgi:hypothetical protein